MNLQVISVMVLVSLALVVLISFLAAGPRRTRKSRYRPGEAWDYAPVWWSANPDGAPRMPVEHGEHVAGTGGGADGGW